MAFEGSFMNDISHEYFILKYFTKDVLRYHASDFSGKKTLRLSLDNIDVYLLS